MIDRKKEAENLTEIIEIVTESYYEFCEKFRNKENALFRLNIEMTYTAGSKTIIFNPVK